MKKIKSLGVVILLLTNILAFSQQLPLVSSYYLNSYLSNPAFAGLKGTNVYLIGRGRSLPGTNGPESFISTIDGNFKKGTMGYGAKVYNDVINIIGRIGAYGTYSYKVVLPQNSLLSFGMSLGFEQNRILNDRIEAEVPKELMLANGASKSLFFDANFGISYHIEGLNIGLATYRFLGDNSNIIVNADPAEFYQYHFNRHYVSSVSYRTVLLKDKFFLDPTIQIKMASGMNPSIDASLVGNYEDKYWLGAAWRQKYGVDFIAGAKLFEKATIAYTYAMATSTNKTLNKNLHEITLGFKIGGKALNADTDKDGVYDMFDKELATISGCKVDRKGIALDSDFDKIIDCLDQQLITPFGAPVDLCGIALDSDNDKIIDLYDQEPETIEGNKVDEFGVSIIQNKTVLQLGVLIKDETITKIEKVKIESGLDSDNDGVADIYDKEQYTEHWKHTNGEASKDASECIVDKFGIANDSDGDGFYDCVDEEIFSARGVKVNPKGVANTLPNDLVPEKREDSDNDGISDDLDLELNTPKGVSVDQWGRSPQTNSDPNAVHHIDIASIEDASKEWNYYVIVGVFRYYNNLKNYQKYLIKTYNEQSLVLVTEQNYYYAYSKQVYSKKEAQGEVDRLNIKRLKDYIVGNPWIWREPKI